MNREILINQLNNNISLFKCFIKPDFPGLNILASQYWDVLSKIFNNTKNPYCLVYADVNKLGFINKTYGFDSGDRVLYEILKTYTSSFEKFKDASFIRFGGDEFIFLFPNSSKEEISDILESATNKISKRTDLYDSSLTYSVVSSSMGNIEQIKSIAVQNVVEAKSKRNHDKGIDSSLLFDLPIPKNLSPEQAKKWHTLNTKINILAYNHTQDVRSSSSFQYRIQHSKADAEAFITAFSDLLVNNQKAKNDNIHHKSKNRLNISYENALAIHSLFNGKNIDFCNISDTQLKELDNSLTNLCTQLVKNRHSNLFNEAYYTKFIAPRLLESNTSYQVSMMSTSAIKMSNTAYGYEVTDNRLVKTSNLIKKAVKDNRDYEEDNFSFNKDSIFLIDLKGGDYLLLIPQNNALSRTEIKYIENYVNSHFTDGKDSTFNIKITTENYTNKDNPPIYAKSTDSKMQMIVKNYVNKYTIPLLTPFSGKLSSKFSNLMKSLGSKVKNMFNKNSALPPAKDKEYTKSTQPFVRFVRNLKDKCDVAKDDLMVDRLHSSINVDSIAERSHDCLNYFLNEIDDSNSIKSQQMFLNNMLIALSNHQVHVNQIHDTPQNNLNNEINIFINR